MIQFCRLCFLLLLAAKLFKKIDKASDFSCFPMFRRMVNGNDVHNMPLSAGERPEVPRGVVMQEPPDPNDIEQVCALENQHHHC